VASSPEHGLCGSGSEWSVRVAFLGPYLLLGSWAVLRPERSAWGWPLAIVLAVTAALIVQAHVPGGHGFCES
jgi:hypothetical protein